ncbi:hypothetical protein NL108_015999 [Boleophthalmus pectinirostris]|nr:hypothetical protein NL108_015999 [Boleophthalmus pectinirostris]
MRKCRSFLRLRVVVEFRYVRLIDDSNHTSVFIISRLIRRDEAIPNGTHVCRLRFTAEHVYFSGFANVSVNRDDYPGLSESRQDCFGFTVRPPGVTSFSLTPNFSFCGSISVFSCRFRDGGSSCRRHAQ